MTPDQIFALLGLLAGLGISGWLAWQWRQAELRDRQMDALSRDELRRSIERARQREERHLH